MKFRTIVPTQEYPFRIAHQEPLLSVGSCFTEHIGDKLARLKFTVCQNPYGIVYNPMSILAQLTELMAAKLYDETDLQQYQRKYFSWQHHSQFSQESIKATVMAINAALAPVHDVFRKLKHLHLTFGTAWVYERNASKTIVANCHKHPSAYFEKKILSVAQIVEQYSKFFVQYFLVNPDVQVVLTLSPVRHVRDGIVEDRLSKSVLRIAIEALSQEFPNVHYFPSYELVTDDLRDYRFFKDDLVHPTTFAIEYVWEYFAQSFFEEGTKVINQEVDAIQKRLQHIGHPADQAYQKFAEATLWQIEELRKRYSFIKF
jgi:GSCFA family